MGLPFSYLVDGNQSWPPSPSASHVQLAQELAAEWSAREIKGMARLLSDPLGPSKLLQIASQKRRSLPPE